MVPSIDDRQLLADYAEEGSHDAFARLVTKYSSMVFNTALRKTRNHALSEDVTQAVFIVLARTAKTIKAKPSIAGWLHQTALYAASNALRAQTRRRRQETLAAKSQADPNVSFDATEEMTALVESELHRLAKLDRQMLVSHYLEGKTLPQIADDLGINYEASRKRLSRALSRLRKRIACSGSAADLTAIPLALGAITTNASHSSAGTVASTAIAGGHGGNAFTLAADVLHRLRILSLQKAAGVAAIVALCGGMIGLAVAQLPPKEPVPITPSSPQPSQVPTKPVWTNVLAVASPTTQPLGPEDAAAIRKAVLARFQILQNVSAAFEMKTFYPPLTPGEKADTPIEGGMILRAVNDADNVSSKCYFSYLNGRIIWSVSEKKLGSPAPYATEDRVMINGDVRSQLLIYRDGQKLGYVAQRTREGNPGTAVERALGLRVESREEQWITPDILSTAELTGRGDDLVQLTFLAGSMKYHQWTLSRRLGYAIIAYQINPHPAGASFELQCRDFREIAGVMMPMSISARRLSYSQRELREIIRDEIAVKDYEIQDPQNSPDRYLMRWPMGARVKDFQTDTSFIVDVEAK